MGSVVKELLVSWVALVGVFASVLGVPDAAYAQKISSVSVTATGVGVNADDAVTRALVRAISQVNGESVAASMKLSSKTNETSRSNADGTVSSSFSDSESLEQRIENKTRGVVKSWRLLSSRALPSGDTEATISADVFVLERSKQLDRLKIAVVGGHRSNTEFAKLVLGYVTDDLVKSRKLAVMDRKNAAPIEAQISRIKGGGGAIEDQLRLSAELAPDLLAILSTELVGKDTPRQRVVVSLELIDYASKQVKFSEKKSRLVKPDSYSRIDMMARGVAKGLYRTVLQTAFPPVVVGVDGSLMTIGQGRDFFSVGDKVRIKVQGAPVRDPHTGEFLSHVYRDAGDAVISFADARISQAKFSGRLDLDAGQISKGKVQVFRLGDEPSALFAFDDGDTPKSGAKSKAMFSTGIDDDDD
jgi:hypothetical protein